MTFTAVVGALFMVFGGGMCGWFTWALFASMKSRDWPTAMGEVISSRVEISYDEGQEKRRAVIRYAYSVASSQFESSRVVFGDLVSSPPALVARYPIGAKVRVFYDPDDPREAVLEPGASRKLFAAAFLGVAFVAIGAFAAFSET